MSYYYLLMKFLMYRISSFQGLSRTSPLEKNLQVSASIIFTSMASDTQEIHTRKYNHSFSFSYQFYFFIRFHFSYDLAYLSFIPVPFLQIPLFRCYTNSLQQPHFWFPPFTPSNRHLANYLFCGLHAYCFCMYTPQQCSILYLLNNRPTSLYVPLPLSS